MGVAARTSDTDPASSTGRCSGLLVVDGSFVPNSGDDTLNRGRRGHPSACSYAAQTEGRSLADRMIGRIILICTSGPAWY